MAEKRTTSGTTKKATGKTSARSHKPAPKGHKTAAAKPTSQVTAEQRWRMIADAAFYRAERRGFTPGGEVNDWLEAEAEIEVLLASPKGGNSKRRH